MHTSVLGTHGATAGEYPLGYDASHPLGAFTAIKARNTISATLGERWTSLRADIIDAARRINPDVRVTFAERVLWVVQERLSLEAYARRQAGVRAGTITLPTNETVVHVAAQQDGFLLTKYIETNGISHVGTLGADARCPLLGERVALALDRPTDTRPPLQSAYHELWHSVQELITDEEKALLARAITKPDGWDQTEREAEAFGYWAARVHRPRAGAEAVFWTIGGFFAATAEAMTRHGFDNLGDALRDLGVTGSFPCDEVQRSVLTIFLDVMAGRMHARATSPLPPHPDYTDRRERLLSANVQAPSIRQQGWIIREVAQTTESGPVQRVPALVRVDRPFALVMEHNGMRLYDRDERRFLWSDAVSDPETACAAAERVFLMFGCRSLADTQDAEERAALLAAAEEEALHANEDEPLWGYQGGMS